MPTANRNVTQIDVGAGLLYIAKLGTTEPVDLIDSAWPSAWVELGYTEAGSEFKVAPTVDDITVAEERDPVMSVVASVKSTLNVALAQVTAFNLAVALGGGTITTASGLTTFEPPAAGTEKVVMLGWRAADLSEAMLWRRCKATGALDMKRSSGKDKVTLPVEFQILAVTGAQAWKWFAKDPDRTGPLTTLIY